MNIVGSYPKTRLRRLRKSKWLRNLISETSISNNDLILPIFIREGKNKIESIKSMPGIKRYTLDKLSAILNQVRKYTQPSTLQSNCSGKHSGMLLLCKLLNADLKGYERLDHPVQKKNSRDNKFSY